MSAIRTLLSSRPVAYYPELARAVGGIAPALFLQQIAHWQGNDTERWIFRTAQELEAELAMSPEAQANARGKLKALGVLEEEHGRGNRLYYRVVWPRLEKVLNGGVAESRNREQRNLETATSGNQKPGTAVSLIDESIDESRDENRTPPGGTGADAPVAADEFVAQLDERLRDSLVPLTQSRKARYGREFKDALKANRSARELDEAVDRIVERWEEYQLSVEQALRDLQNGNNGNGKETTKATTKKSATPEGGLELLRQHDKLSRYAYLAEQWDFTSPQDPPWPVYSKLGGTEDERWSNLSRMRSVARRGKKGDT